MLTHPERLVIHVRNAVVDSAGQADTLRLLKSYRELKKTEAGKAEAEKT